MVKVSGELILVVEDESRIGELLERYLRSAGFRTEWAKNGKEALQLWRSAGPALILLDVMIPELSGLEVMRQIRRESDLPILLLTARVEETDRVVGLELGADDYISKPFSPREVVARVRAVLRRMSGGLKPPERYTVGPLEVDLEAFQARCSGQALSLSPSQLRLLAALAAAPNRAFSRAELLEALGEVDIDERTVDAHIKNLRARMGPCGECLQTVRGLGYRLAGEP